MKNIILFAGFLLTSILAHSADDIVIADFEGDDYGAWTTTGDAFGSGPAHGALPNQSEVKGFAGHGFADSFHNGDGATGTLTSPYFTIERHFINFLIGGGGLAGKTCMNLLVDGNVVRTATGPNTSPGGEETLQPQSWDVSEFAGKEATLEIIDHATGGWGHINVDQIVESDTNGLYHEALRPQFHFSAIQGFINDPNGLVFYEGEYHLFFQHRGFPGSTGVSWGHAVSSDLVHWKELGEAIKPDSKEHEIWSGSASVDVDNTSGLGEDGKPPLILIYTAWGAQATQGMAYSLDGRTFTKYTGNPVVPQITGNNRDPNFFWYEPTHNWIMVLYGPVPIPPGKAVDPRFIDFQTHGEERMHFLSSPDLKQWTVMNDMQFSWECPGFFSIPLDGNAGNTKWILTSASGCYKVGTFDGTNFNPETPLLSQGGDPLTERTLGGDSYAAQIFRNMPEKDGRRIRISWMRANSPGMPFDQSMSIPIELKLITTAEGPRLTYTPVKELETLRGHQDHIAALTLRPGDANPLANVHGELLEIRIKFRPQDAKEIQLNVRGASVVYDAANQQIKALNSTVPAPLREGSQELTIYMDRTSMEVFGDGGLVYIPHAFIPKAENNSVEIGVTGGSAQIETLDVYQLNSAWK